MDCEILRGHIQNDGMMGLLPDMHHTKVQHRSQWGRTHTFDSLALLDLASTLLESEPESSSSDPESSDPELSESDPEALDSLGLNTFVSRRRRLPISPSTLLYWTGVYFLGLPESGRGYNCKRRYDHDGSTTLFKDQCMILFTVLTFSLSTAVATLHKRAIVRA